MIYITKDNFVWKDVTAVCKQKRSAVYDIWILNELYEVTDEETDHLLESYDEVTDAIDNGSRICIEVGHLPTQYKPKQMWSNTIKKLIGGYWYVRMSDIQ